MSYCDAVRQAVSAIQQRRAAVDVLSFEAFLNAVSSYDGRRIAVLGDGILQVWTREPLAWERSFLLPSKASGLRHYHNHDDPQGAGLSFSPDGSWVAVNGSGEIWRCDLATGSMTSFCSHDGSPPDALGFAKDGRLVGADCDGEVRAWDAEGKPVSAADLRVEPVRAGRGAGLARIKGQGGPALKLSSREGAVGEGPLLSFIREKWWASVGEKLWARGFEDVGFSPDGRRITLVADEEERTARTQLVWDLAGESPPLGFEVGQNLISTAASAFSPDGRLLAHAAYDEYSRQIYSAVQEDEDERLIVTIEYWERIQVRDLDTGRVIFEVAAPRIEGTDDIMKAEVIRFVSPDVLLIVWRNNPWVLQEEIPRISGSKPLVRPLAYRIPDPEPLPPGALDDLPPVGDVLTYTDDWMEIRSLRTWDVLWKTKRPPGYRCAALGPLGTLAIAERGGHVKLRAPGRGQRRFYSRVTEPHHLAWAPGEEALQITDAWGVAWHRPDGECLGWLPLSLAERVAFAPGKHLLALLRGGQLVRWRL